MLHGTMQGYKNKCKCCDCLAAGKAYRQENKERVAKNSQVWFQANKHRPEIKTKRQELNSTDRAKTSSAVRKKRYLLENPEMKRAENSRRRMRTKIGMSKLDVQKSKLYRLQIVDNCCGYCGRHSQIMHDDHVYPLALGGTDHWWNLIRACSGCNLSKGAKRYSAFNR